MDRAKQVEFCKKCKHRKPDIKQGLLCSLTNAKADFDVSCENYSEDNSAKEYYKQQKKGIRKETIAAIIGTLIMTLFMAGKVYVKHIAHNQKQRIEYHTTSNKKLKFDEKQVGRIVSIQKFIDEENASCPIRYDDEFITLIKVQRINNTLNSHTLTMKLTLTANTM